MYKWISKILDFFNHNSVEKFIKIEKFNKIPFDAVCLYKDEQRLQMDIWFDWKKYEYSPIWEQIQREILITLTREYVTILHIIDTSLGYGEDEYTTANFDDKIGNIYPLYRDKVGNCLIEIMPQDCYLLNELQKESILWECDCILHIATFEERNEKGLRGNFEDAEFILSDFVDNLGFIIDVKDMETCGAWIEKVVQDICDKYECKLEYKSPIGYTSSI